MNDSKQNDKEIATKSIIIFSSVFAFGLIGIFFNTVDNFKSNGWTILGNSLLIAGGAFLIGLLLGFLFGIPRTLQGDVDETKTDEAKKNIYYKVNTNLEQISDWLTKILVGVGLTQLNKIPTLLRALSVNLKPAMGNQSNSGLYGVAVLIFFSSCGFLTGYLVTRIYIGRIFKIADQSVLEKEIEDLKKQSNYDAIALEMVTQQLSQVSNSKVLKESDIKMAIENASPSARFTIFVEAHKTRKNNWKTNKDLMEKTIPIFYALIDAEKNNPNHQYYAQLAYALKDKNNPDFQLALENLNKAINIRGSYKKYGWTLYEFNSAICKIMLDGNFRQGSKSPSNTKESIVNDLKAIKNEIGAGNFKELLETAENVVQWLSLNEVNLF
jgi:tetratricopeptide (TPR) repeat protein